jgi:superfamily II DNA or RNA helicase
MCFQIRRYLNAIVLSLNKSSNVVMTVLDEHIQLFISLFKGREDVFAVRWEKENKSSYMPAYDINWEEFSKHKAKGGTLKDFNNKKYSRLTDQRIINHLSGKEVIGLYPLLADNSSWFIVADFDENLVSKNSWINECRVFIEACNSYQLPVYLERSRSGKGGHIWLFFDAAYPAFKSRKLMLHILRVAGIISPFDKNSNYDRLFPNQDYHSGKGLGNLIALPLQKKAVENNNSCFIDPLTQESFKDQFEFLKNIQRVTITSLENIFNDITSQSSDINEVRKENLTQNGILITLNKQINIARKHLTPALIIFLRDSLNFVNSDYIIKRKLGKNIFGTTPYFKLLEEKGGIVFLPKGFIGKLLRYCNEQKIAYHLIDERKKLAEVNYSFKASLHQYQQEAFDMANKKDMGVIVAPPGSGKTIIGLCIVANKKQPALIIVHRKQLFDQWIERIQFFLGIAEQFIGKIAAGHQKVGTYITVAMIQSLATLETSNDLFSSFGLIIIDECHHVPAKTFRDTISRFSSYYLYGLTATPIRKNNDERLIFIHIGDVVATVKSPVGNESPSGKLAVVIRETTLLIPFDYKTDQLEMLNQILIHDSARNQLIIEDIKLEATTGKKILVLTERKAHIDILRQYLKSTLEVITISGDDEPPARKLKLQQIKEGNFQVLIATGQYLGEGTDFDDLSCLVLAYPFAFEGKLIQYIGRVQRSANTPIIYDYRDVYIDYLEKQFRQRNQYYKKLLNIGQLHKFEELLLIFDGQKVFIDSPDYSIRIGCLELPVDVETFKEGLIWKIRVLSYDEENAVLMTEIIDYKVKLVTNTNKQVSLNFLIIDKIKFRSIDTTNLLLATELKKMPLFAKASAGSHNHASQSEIEKPIKAPIENTFSKIMKVPFSKIRFLYAGVSFLLFIEEFNLEMTFTIDNPDIRPEFEVIKEYFIKALKKKLITVEIKILYNDKEIISSLAESEDINKINNSLIDSVRFEFVKREVLSFKNLPENSSMLNTMGELLAHQKNASDLLLKDEQDLIDGILGIKSCRHYHQLKYLCSQHFSTVLKIRFVLAPFSFLFLLSGDKMYHLIWETLDSEEATYIWHFEKSMDALRNGLKEIEAILNEIKATSKQDYLKKDNHNLSRIIHDYGDAKSGFIVWKGMLEEKLN